MLARIVYYRENTLPEELVVAVNSIEKAEKIAREKMGEFKAVDFEVEMIA
ncbi:hypothetical protein TON_1117 [Thermococcus onnurineus NA1]|uniref:Uncharacterized protein n=1 Tax=Thermococcus onnurineus (strain NA1) TaxID=523850 RepID=B6YWZ2_THEON|nr:MULTISPECIES: hypothetical protein [Thermococcus]ACJ16605.1 hypothetical protein TON_1117 [Thermococcus onnurineus NA1]